MEECLADLDTDPASVRAQAFDFVLNGVELSSGSLRITDPELQAHMFSALGLSDEEAEQKFGFLTGAFKYGAPPHGGMGLGLDRICMIMTGSDSLRDVLAFPKVANSSELMSGALALAEADEAEEDPELHAAKPPTAAKPAIAPPSLTNLQSKSTCPKQKNNNIYVCKKHSDIATVLFILNPGNLHLTVQRSLPAMKAHFLCLLRSARRRNCFLHSQTARLRKYHRFSCRLSAYPL